ncbi:GyrI-like domain-containing protein [Ectobacillus polymachus]|uniref:GyrI-like domain-containing protein n=1 Tax=Ectobacillus polymachus TaxID=1508806 RepID=UPI003A891451
MSNTITKSEVVERKGFVFLGRSIKTTNKAEMNGKGEIPGFWDAFYENQVMDTIPNKKNSNIIALYTNYESDETGVYTFALGTEVSESDEKPIEMDLLKIPDEKYIIFTTRKGPIPEVVIEAWREIWSWSEDRERAFKTDFELYDSRAKDPQNSQVDIYISVK